MPAARSGGEARREVSGAARGIPGAPVPGDGDGERSLLGRRGVNEMKIILIIAYINHVFNMFYPIEFNMF